MKADKNSTLIRKIRLFTKKGHNEQKQPENTSNITRITNDDSDFVINLPHRLRKYFEINERHKDFTQCN